MSDAAPKPEPGKQAQRVGGAGSEARDLNELYRRYFPELVRFVRRTFGSGPPEPEDAVQAAFEHYAALAKPEQVESPRAFLYWSARNFVVDQKRRMKIHARWEEKSTDKLLGERDDLDAERVLSAKERLRIIDAAILNMKPKMREVFILHRIHELSYAEISRRRRISQTVVKKLVARAVLICEQAILEADKPEGSGV